MGDEETRASSSRARRLIAGSLRIGEYLLTRANVARRGGTRQTATLPPLSEWQRSQWRRSNANAGGGTFILARRTARCRRLQEYTRVTFEYKRWLLATLLVKGVAQLLWVGLVRVTARGALLAMCGHSRSVNRSSGLFVERGAEEVQATRRRRGEERRILSVYAHSLSSSLVAPRCHSRLTLTDSLARLSNQPLALQPPQNPLLSTLPNSLSTSNPNLLHRIPHHQVASLPLSFVVSDRLCVYLSDYHPSLHQRHDLQLACITHTVLNLVDSIMQLWPSTATNINTIASSRTPL